MLAKAWKSTNINQAGIYVFNDMYTHADTFYTGANWRLVSFSNEVCEVSPLLDSYYPVKDKPMARVSKVWIKPTTSREYLIVCDQLLWF